MTTLVSRLRERKVGQWALAYLAGGWLFLQVLDFLVGAYAWPQVVLRIAPPLLAVGLLVTLVLAWYHGEQGRQRVSGPELLMLATLFLIGGGVMAVFAGRRPAVAEAAVAASSSEDQPSVAVLPFANLSADAENEYFSDGVTEEILNALAQMPGLRVPARTSSFAFKGQNVAVREIARQLGVAHILEGSIRRSGDQVRITAQLIDARTDEHLWSETYDRTLSDVFQAQEEIGRAIADELKLRLPAGGATLAGLGGTTNPRAYELYLQALQAWNERTAASLRRAIDLLAEAVQVDPRYARAYGLAALAWGRLPGVDLTVRNRDATAAARAAAERALALDSTVVEAWSALGRVGANADLDLVGAESAYQRALAANPNDALAHNDFAVIVLSNVSGRAEEALEHAREAVRLDPLSAPVRIGLGITLARAGKTEESVAALREGLSTQPSSVAGWSALAADYLQLARFDSAAAAASRIRPEGGTTDAEEVRFVFENLGVASARSRIQGILDRWRVEGSWQTVGPAGLAVLYLRIGATERALDVLEGAEKEREVGVIALAVEPGYAPLRGNPRFETLLKRLGVATPTSR